MTDLPGTTYAGHDVADAFDDNGPAFRDTARATGTGSGTLRDQAIGKLRSFADQGKAEVTGSLDGLVEAARDIADKVGDEGSPLGRYAHIAVDTLEGWADGVKAKSIEELIDDGRDFARRSPAVAIGLSVVAGFALSRFLKAGGGTA